MLSLLVVVELLVVLWPFLALAKVCDDYLVPALEILCERFAIPDEAAGASILAFGSSAPEILINVAAVTGTTGDVDISINAIMGSAIIAYGLIPGLCALCALGNGEEEGESPPLMLQTYPVLRDVFFYIAGLVFLVKCVEDGELDATESASLCFVFILYLAAIYVPIKYLWPRAQAGYQDIRDLERMSTLDREQAAAAGAAASFAAAAGPGRGSLVAPEAPLRTGTVTETAQDSVASESDDNAHGGRFDALFHAVSLPIDRLFTCTIPDCESSPDRYILCFGAALVYVALISDVVLLLSKQLAAQLTLPHSVVGGTLLALGAQVPDTIASLAMAKNNMANGAVSNAIGSQIINITLGTGLPYLIYTWYHDRPMHVPMSTHIRPIATALAVNIGLYIVCTFCSLGMRCPPRCGLNRAAGMLMVVGYGFSNAYMVLGAAR